VHFLCLDSEETIVFWNVLQWLKSVNTFRCGL